VIAKCKSLFCSESYIQITARWVFTAISSHSIWTESSSFRRRNLWTPDLTHSNRCTVRNTPWPDARCALKKLNDSIFLPCYLQNIMHEIKNSSKAQKHTRCLPKYLWKISRSTTPLAIFILTKVAQAGPQPILHSGGHRFHHWRTCAWSRQIAFARWLEGNTNCRAGRRRA
jgi:hypothetical protein